MPRGIKLRVLFTYILVKVLNIRTVCVNMYVDFGPPRGFLEAFLLSSKLMEEQSDEHKFEERNNPEARSVLVFH